VIIGFLQNFHLCLGQRTVPASWGVYKHVTKSVNALQWLDNEQECRASTWMLSSETFKPPLHKTRFILPDLDHAFAKDGSLAEPLASRATPFPDYQFSTLCWLSFDFAHSLSLLSQDVSA
jgi:hypothetical protein